MEELLQNAGLTPFQTACYLYLLENGATAPPKLAMATKLTRSNAYKVLQTLETLKLVRRTNDARTIRYEAADPIALVNLAAEQRNRAIALEQGVKAALQELRTVYMQSTGIAATTISYGSEAMINEYETQAENRKPIYFIKSRADIPFLGFEVMDRLRRLPARYHTTRYGITPDAAEMPSPEADLRSNLVRTIMPDGSYTAPVEWSKSGDVLSITVFADEGRVIRIQDKMVVESFEQIWKLLSEQLQKTS